MRPITKSKFPPASSNDVLVPFLLQGLGPYCSLCERPLPDECWLFDKDSGFTYSSSAELRVMGAVKSWDRYLVLDRNCAINHTDKTTYYLSQVARQMLLPDGQELSFRRNGAKTIEYKRRSVDVTLMDEEGDDPEEMFSAELVLAVGHTPAAKLTIEHFALNTRYYLPARDDEAAALVIPRHEYYSAIDRRLEQRTRAWDLAVRLSDLAAEIRDEARDSMVDQIRMTMASIGFWSTWATVFSQRIRNDELFRQLMEDPAKVDWSIGPGPHNPFPGTRSAWINE